MTHNDDTLDDRILRHYLDRLDLIRNEFEQATSGAKAKYEEAVHRASDEKFWLTMAHDIRRREEEERALQEYHQMSDEAKRTLPVSAQAVDVQSFDTGFQITVAVSVPGEQCDDFETRLHSDGVTLHVKVPA